MQVEDELRPVTALFADVVGSTALGERLAPDEVQALVGECVTRLSRAVEEFGGSVQSYLGDGICAAFGLPVAHEDDPERAARAALRITAVVGEYARDVEAAWGIAGFDVRVGLNTGQAAVGLVGGGDPQALALGDAMNVAARLQAAAAPGAILVGPTTARLLGHRFSLEAVGELQVKGREEPVAASRLLGVRSAARPTVETPLVGRAPELARLGQVLADLEAGRGRVVLLTGDAGIGKTRLMRELATRAADSVVWLEGACASYGGDRLLGPFVDALRAWLGVEEGEADVAVRLRLRARLGALLGDAAPDALAVLGRLLGLRLDPDADRRLDLLPADALAASLRATYLHWLEALAARGPVALVLEDVHWADAATRELAEEALALTDRAPVLLLATARVVPGSEGAALRLRVLSDFAHRAVELPLGPLDDDAAEELVRRLLPGALDDAMRREVVSRAEGNPLFLEELLRALVEGYGAPRDRSWTMTISAASLLPPALEGLLVARIDRLPEGARRVVQAAAVVGRSFPVRVVERVVETSDLQADLAQLLRAEVVREVRRFPELECAFGHGLLQQAALSTLTPERRRELHGRIAAAYEELHGGAPDDLLEVLAYHWGRSQDLAKALEYLERAGERAAALDAGERAEELFRRALRVAERLDDRVAAARLGARLA
ncbi:MAG: adenylate/guanylate cyclase domain-containing protein [Thermoleophilia bacterium]